MSNASARVTVTYRVQVTHTDFLKATTRTFQLKYIRLANAQRAAERNTYRMEDPTGNVLYASEAVIISHTATTPLH